MISLPFPNYLLGFNQINIGWILPEILLMEEIQLTSWCSRYPSIHRVLYIPDAAGFLPSTVFIPTSMPCLLCWITSKMRAPLLLGPGQSTTFLVSQSQYCCVLVLQAVSWFDYATKLRWKLAGWWWYWLVGWFSPRLLVRIVNAQFSLSSRHGSRIVSERCPNCQRYTLVLFS